MKVLKVKTFEITIEEETEEFTAFISLIGMENIYKIDTVSSEYRVYSAVYYYKNERDGASS